MIYQNSWSFCAVLHLQLPMVEYRIPLDGHIVRSTDLSQFGGFTMLALESIVAHLLAIQSSEDGRLWVGNISPDNRRALGQFVESSRDGDIEYIELSSDGTILLQWYNAWLSN